MRSSMGVIGYVYLQHIDICFSCANILSDLAEAFPNGQLTEALRQEWVLRLIKETRTNREYSQRTVETARWARELVKRQIGGTTSVIQT